MMRAVSAVFVCLAAATPALAQDPARYADCMQHTAEEAVDAYEEALAWESQGGGAAARHCAAIALVRLGHEEEAATRLEALTGDPLFAAPEEKAELLRQAASAWLIAGEIARAEAAATNAIAVTPGVFDLLLLRAQVRIAAQDYAGAQADLTESLALDGQNAEALLLRAQANLALQALPAALADAEAAVAADPQNVQARLVLGDVREAIRVAGEAD
jgi:tetratricopeptide (TPR) repeat protein